MIRGQVVAAENGRVREGSVMALWSSLRGWPVWQLPRWLAVCVTAVIAANAAAVTWALASEPVRLGDLRLCAVFVACGAASVELTRRAGEQEGLTRDVYGIWDLPAAVLLPPLYALLIPLPRAVLTEWRIRRTLLHRRAYSTAVACLANAAASLVFRSAAPALGGGGAGSGGHALAWITLAAGSGLVSMAVEAGLILPPIKVTAPPGTRLRSLALGQEAVCNQVIELCLAVLTAFATAYTALALVVALPLAIVLQRSLRHASLAAAARTDAKTGLLNAGSWQREAAVEVTRAAAAQAPLAVAIADIDHFKAVNDTRGHLAGDAVLAAVSAAMRDLLRDCDLCGRFGGEEFALLLPRTTAAQALEIAERIRQGISQLATPRDGVAIRVTISIGVAVPSHARHTLDDLLAAADHALYQAKGSGRDRVVMYADTRVSQASRPLPLERTNLLLG
jgi:diguanylate cyclase (GGDEF)-like protein